MTMEHRWGRRQPIDSAVQFVTQQGLTGAGRLLNLSATGAFMQTAVVLKSRTLVRLQASAASSLADGHGCIAATVVRTDPVGVGLEWCEFLRRPPVFMFMPAA